MENTPADIETLRAKIDALLEPAGAAGFRLSNTATEAAHGSTSAPTYPGMEYSTWREHHRRIDCGCLLGSMIYGINSKAGANSFSGLFRLDSRLQESLGLTTMELWALEAGFEGWFNDEQFRQRGVYYLYALGREYAGRIQPPSPATAT